jgi:FtsZ-binding cell division protein ZapB
MHLVALFATLILSSKVEEKAKDNFEKVIHKCKNDAEKEIIETINPALRAIDRKEFPIPGENGGEATDQPVPEDVVKLKEDNKQLLNENKQLKENGEKLNEENEKLKKENEQFREDNQKLLRNFEKQENKFKEQKKELNYLEDFRDDIPVVMILLLVVPLLALFICSILLHYILLDMYLPYKPKGSFKSYCCSYGKC